MRTRNKQNGQSMVELALLFPFLLILLVATVEAGFALRDYLMVQSVNREGARWAARTPPGEEYHDYFRGVKIPETFERVVSAGKEGGLDGNELAVIVTHISIDDAGIPTYDSYFTGTLPSGPIGSGDTRVNPVLISDQNATKTANINLTRQAGMYDPLENEIVIVEVFYNHKSLWFYDFVGPLGMDWVMYTQSTMRMVGTGR
ncbi:MAG: TadE/TadG family type IV pilus assembly protein [Chloroflexota bacterium]|nr:TadE/TadG family type IV pilus assembly protein [Chloroflexota bacterium]